MEKNPHYQLFYAGLTFLYKYFISSCSLVFMNLGNKSINIKYQMKIAMTIAKEPLMDDQYYTHLQQLQSNFYNLFIKV